ncbi:hypothetical protein GCM10025777_21430 [Membranihabitans marinus]
MNREKWKNVLTLDVDRTIVAGDHQSLVDAISNGADLRIYTEFRHNEHVDIHSDNNEWVKEVADYRVTYLLNNEWTAGIVTLRVPINPPVGFGTSPSMSFFMYNQDGSQGIARPYLEKEDKSNGKVDDHIEMARYNIIKDWDQDSLAPSRNFVYDFDTYRFFVDDSWEEVFVNDGLGEVLRGSLSVLEEAFSNGMEVKVGVTNLCRDLLGEDDYKMDHEVFIQCGSCYYYSESKIFCAGSHPLVRVKPSIPLKYESGGWDFGWLMLRTDGSVSRWIVDPYTLKFIKSEEKYQLRWFVK